MRDLIGHLISPSTINIRATFERLNCYETPSEPSSGHSFGNSPNVHENNESRQFVKVRNCFVVVGSAVLSTVREHSEYFRELASEGFGELSALPETARELSDNSVSAILLLALCVLYKYVESFCRHTWLMQGGPGYVLQFTGCRHIQVNLLKVQLPV